MFRRPGVLKTRLQWTLVAMTAGTAALVALALWISDTYIEDAVLRDLMDNELTVMADAADAGRSGELTAGNLRYFDERTVPPVLRAYPPGHHSDIVFEDRDVELLVRDLAPGHRAYLAYDATLAEHRERALAVVTGIVLLAIMISSGAIAGAIAQRLLRPLYSVVAQLRALDPERGGQRLSSPYVDSELNVFVDSMNQYMARLDALVERERAFAAAASHELRTPLAVIQGAAETLALAGETAPLIRIRRAVREARLDLDALLALSRLREAPAHEPLRLPEFLRSVADIHLADPATRTKLIWDAPKDFEVHAPPGALAVIFGNLLRNALRAAAAGTVTVRVRAPDLVELHDSGPGIPPDELPQVFEPGFRGRDGGTGMGLYISRVLADRFGWQLSLSNHPQGGAVARLRLTAPGEAKMHA
ncbi:HAMP domain-containing sensor histidine kinase [Fontimonas sp. SYSU GA230001]|uniref:sensor histidine kinase n=1 Tax=Fontimonas sp. SYSU GA230001 TaxID=3142450 RepID=UPI0032B577AD